MSDEVKRVKKLDGLTPFEIEILECLANNKPLATLDRGMDYSTYPPTPKGPSFATQMGLAEIGLINYSRDRNCWYVTERGNVLFEDQNNATD